MAKIKATSVNRVKESVEMEKITDYTCNLEYTQIWQKLMSHEEAFMKAVTDHSKPSKINIEWLSYGVEHLRKYGGDVVKQAFDLRMRMVAYWKIVLRRMVDCMALHMLFSIQNLVNRDMEYLQQHCVNKDSVHHIFYPVYKL